jgi:ferredoxin
MLDRFPRAFVVTCSPSGATRHVGEVFRSGLAARGADVTALELGATRDWSPVIRQIDTAAEPVALFIGSPVYAGIPVPPVMDFIAALGSPAPGSARWAVPFVTWGMVTTGMALWHLGRALLDRGFRLAGGASVPAQHSLHWPVVPPVGQGRPGAQDDARIAQMLAALAPRLQNPAADPLPLDAFDFREPDEAQRLKQRRFDTVRGQLPPKTLDPDRCDACGTCEMACPVEAITCHPALAIDADRCIVCFNCVRLCPQGAVQADLTRIFDGLPEWAAHAREPHETRVFV